jgi:hypothetical protein
MPTINPDINSCRTYIRKLENDKIRFLTHLASLNKDSDRYNYILQKDTISEILAVLFNGIRKLYAWLG